MDQQPRGAAIDCTAISAAVVAVMPSPLGVYRSDGACVLANQALADLVGGELPALHRQNFRELESWARLGMLVAAERALAGGGRQVVPVDGPSIFGKPVCAEITFSRFVSGGEPFLLLLGRDVTEERRAADALHASEARYRGVVESQTDMVVRYDLEGRATFVNEVVGRTLGVPAADLVGVPWMDYILPEDSEATAAAFAGAAQPPEYRAHVENRVAVPGGVRWFAWEGCAVHDPAGGIAEFQAVGRDITEWVATRDRLTRLVGDLDSSNRELEQYAYVASHDLREPLRMVSAYVDLLDRRYGDKLDADAREFIAFARDGAQRMDGMILDLLQLSRVGRMGDPAAVVRLHEVVAEALENLAVSVRECAATITLPERLPEVWGSRNELVRLFQNLIANALKYRHDQRTPEIAVTVEAEGDDWLFAVADNGIGIEAQYGERIFMIFQRLHARDRYDGTGIGLALCRKIVHHHGGRIWVRSDPGQGSTFLFTLPRRRENDQ
ncbi:ATP-binding protein [Magnetospirillum sp. UT-4]|uniref:sensor histidine kinase n=1 Tax=Magnetospirillum sp. UT-4 TaxID=2681467 RepID=UPI00137FAA9D|nr:PAS domain-containing sensor histidine kinase [Magnetospirillum sp. UT-4]CAA7626444.1 putative Histidine kinase [Magnetospirillum sp. UT-4]